MKKRFALIALIIALCNLPAQSQTEKIKITGTVYDPENKGSIPNLMIVNKRTQQGFFGYNSGDFEIEALKSDTLIIAATGFATMTISFRDSVPASVYTLKIPLKKLQVQLKQVEVFTNRDLEQIQRDIEKLGYEKSDYTLQGVSAVESPITALYQAFSRRERNKREVAEMRNDDQRRALLKELFRKYVDNDIIQLDNNEFDEFIDFCGVSDDFLKNSTQYDFIMYVKKRFEVFRMVRNRW
ncbi:MAG: carboxypeptidase-like regulatory domain-containing protein [Bacteroidota bacterium]|nr:carboxypeptidase-like regulatory domain-containing protein [Bacteroidota bacterium]